MTIGYNNSLQVCRLLLCLYTLFDDFIYHIECKCETNVGTVVKRIKLYNELIANVI